MSVIEIRVTRYGTDDGAVFDDKEEAQEHDAVSHIFELLKKCEKLPETACDFYHFLNRNRDEIIELMGWENENECPETITINGKEYAAPLRVAPEPGTKYYWYSSICGVKNDIWGNDCLDNERLSSNCVFVLHDDCQAVADAFNVILTGDDNE